MKTVCKRMVWIGLLTVGLAFGTTGCDDAETGSALIVTPEDSEVAGNGSTVFLTAALASDDDPTNRNEEIIYPLEWSVRNPTLGGIMNSSGNSAVYESNGARGQNVVFAKDQFGREGLAVINQR